METVFVTLLFSMFICKVSCDGDYILNTAKCKIPDLQLFNEDVRSIIKLQSYQPCNKSELPSHVERNQDNLPVLHLREDLLSDSNVTCCYAYVTRSGSVELPDVGFKVSECRRFDNPVVMDEDTVKVSCTRASAPIYENVHNAITINRSVKEKITNATSKLSVLFIVIDSISRLNFIRTMPQTYEFLTENNFVEMKGYTKVADNTFPNFVSLLTGLGLGEMAQKCKAREIGGMDACPMIWYDFRRNGYVTAYAEDNTPISTFNYRKKGFVNPPTDYYFKPYIEAAERLGVRYLNGMPYCAGPETAGERILNLARDFVTTFRHQATFGIFWMNTFSHDSINAPSTMDGKVREFFDDLRRQGALDDRIVVLLSDHGIRFGQIRTTKSGWLEERTPVNMISVPATFQRKYHRQYRHLRANARKLTSTYDLFATLEDILVLSGTGYDRNGSLACPKCVSLFEEVPDGRSCEDAGVPEEWCTCGGRFRTLNETDEYVQNATRLAIEIVNEARENPAVCGRSSLRRVISGSISESLSDGSQYVFVSFETVLTDVFLATVRFVRVVNSDSSFYIRRINHWDVCLKDVISNKGSKNNRLFD